MRVKFEIGARVYEPYAPQKAGIIVELLPSRRNCANCSPYEMVKVAWLNGTTTESPLHHLNCFDSLIADHEKKLNTHLKTHARLKELESKCR